jgi:DNA-directed RNA polymerase subunit RPC12/RpoP
MNKPKKPKFKTWKELKDNKCPTCKQDLQKGMFNDPYTACQNCGFTITDAAKDVLVDRDHKNPRV